MLPVSRFGRTLGFTLMLLISAGVACRKTTDSVAAASPPPDSTSVELSPKLLVGHWQADMPDRDGSKKPGVFDLSMPDV
ncbi:MAG TPA: hypothetical protein VHV77_02905, partial [Pirellulales bacterium]|nr:hypothetical protein [Pirellulales bacterium]